MEIRVLGTLGLWHDGEPVEVGAARVRGLLALLVVSANQVVRRDRLIDELWDGVPPPSARGTLQSCVYRLRKLLQSSGEGEVVLRTRESGYVLLVPDDRLDVGRFQGLVEEAHGLLDAGEPESAVDVLREGLRLWRGEAFADVELAVVRTHADALRERRWDATELYLSSVLSLGRQAEVLGEVEEYVAANPLRERGWELLMTARYQAGRRAEALEAYRTVYDLLDEQLGIEPGRSLRELHERILNADPGLDPAADGQVSRPAGAGRTDRVVPHQLPVPVRHLAGRADVLKQLDQAHQWGESEAGLGHIVVLTGSAGVGKTTLAVHWAERVRDRFPDGILFYDLRGFGASGQVADPASVVLSLLDDLGVAARQIPPGLGAQSALLRSVLAGRRVLVVLDNARDADQVRPVLPGAGTSSALVTSRMDLAGLVATLDARLVRVELLDSEAARELLGSRVGAERVAGEPAAVDALIAGCVGLPLALAIVASRAAARPAWPLAAVAAELVDIRQGLEAFRSEDRSADLTAVLSWSYRALGPDAAGVFRLLSLHPGPDISAAAAASLAGWELVRTRRILDELTTANLLDERSPGRYFFHDLLRLYAGDLAQSEGTESSRQEAVGRLIGHHVHTAHAAALQLSARRDPIQLAPLTPGVRPERVDDVEQAMSWFDAEHPTLLAMVDLAASQGYDVECWQLAWTLVDFLDWRGHWQDWVSTQTTALTAARRSGDRSGEARSYRYLASAAIELGNLDEAYEHLDRSLALLRELGEPAGQGQAHIGLSNLVGRQDRWAEARTHAVQALELFQAAGHRLGEANALDLAAWNEAMLADYQPAMEHGQRAIALFEELDHAHGVAAASHTLGFIRHRQGELAQAIDCLQRSLELYNELGGDRYYQAGVLDLLGDVHRDAGDLAAARDAWQRALKTLDELGHPEAEQVREKLTDLGD